MKKEINFRTWQMCGNSWQYSSEYFFSFFFTVRLLKP